MRSVKTWLRGICAFSILGIGALLHARTFTASDGRTLEGEALSVSGDSAVLKLDGGREVTVPLDKLIEKDREYLASWAKERAKTVIPKVRVNINTNKTDSPQRNGIYERQGQVQIEILVTNDERGFDIEGASATLFVVADSLRDEGDSVIIQRKEFTGIDIDFGRTGALNAETVRYEYDREGSYWYGEKYAGYAVVLRNAQGKVIDVSGSAPRYAGAIDALLQLQEGDQCDKEFRKVSSRGTTRTTQ